MITVISDVDVDDMLVSTSGNTELVTCDGAAINSLQLRVCPVMSFWEIVG